MRVGVFSDYGALNSAPVFDAWRQGAQRLGWHCENHDMTADLAVIWSRLWRGRMRHNREVWQQFQHSGRPVVILEVGTLQRGRTWRMNITDGLGITRWCSASDSQRPQRLGLRCLPWRQAGDHVLVALQRADSEQWRDCARPEQWLADLVSELRRHTDRAIRVRPHPRYRQPIPHGVEISVPRAVANTYDDFDLDRDLQRAWAVVNWNSGPGIASIMSGRPAFVGPSSLAAPVANLDLARIENPSMPDRDQWLIDISHTEFTLEELSSGEPQRSLLQ